MNLFISFIKILAFLPRKIFNNTFEMKLLHQIVNGMFAYCDLLLFQSLNDRLNGVFARIQQKILLASMDKHGITLILY